jgi:purine nucleoside phosphorylase
VNDDYSEDEIVAVTDIIDATVHGLATATDAATKARLRVVLDAVSAAYSAELIDGVYEELSLRRVPLSDGRVVLVDVDDENDDEVIRAALEDR